MVAQLSITTRRSTTASWNLRIGLELILGRLIALPTPMIPFVLTRMQQAVSYASILDSVRVCISANQDVKANLYNDTIVSSTVFTYEATGGRSSNPALQQLLFERHVVAHQFSILARQRRVRLPH